jgi:hypothetical protein
MNRSLKGQAIRPERRTRAERGCLRVPLRRAKASGDLDTWRRAKAVLGYLSVFMVIDNGPCHNLPDEGKLWLTENRHRIELHRLAPYSPELNPMEPVWKVTGKMATHNRFYPSTAVRDAALRATFGAFQRRPAPIAAHVARFQGVSEKVCAARRTDR